MQNQHRQLAAILFTDIVGYTALMQENERKAVVLIKHYNASLNQVVGLHNGKILNNYGDGSLCTFPSVTEALNAAIELQKELQSEPNVPLRIGLHVGEVFFEDEKVLGDGVNVASRIQSLGQANTILFSKEIFDKIRNQPEFKLVSLGLFEFKNVDGPMEVFALANEGLVIPDKKKIEGKLQEKKSSRKKIILTASLILLALVSFFVYRQFFKPTKSGDKEKSIAILPFKVIGNHEDDMTEGLVEDILIQLSKISELNKVISNRSSSKYANSSKTPSEIGDELQVNSLVMGSIQEIGDTIRVSAQLIDSKSGNTLWADNYTREKKQIFDLETEVATQIVNALKAKLTPQEERGLSKRYTENVEAYKLYRKGLFFWNKNDGAYFDSAVLYYKRALDIDPEYALAYPGLAYCYIFLKVTNQREGIPIAKMYATKALSLDSNLSEAITILGFIQSNFDYDWTKSKITLEKAIKLNPNYSEAHLFYGNLLQYTGESTEQGIQEVKRALELDPLNTRFNWILGRNYYLARQYDLAYEQLNRTLILYPDHQFTKETLILLYLEKKKFTEAFGLIRQLPKISYTNGPYQIYYLCYAYAISGDTSRAKSVLEEILKEYPEHTPFLLAYDYIGLKNYNEALNMLESAYKTRAIQLYWVKIDPNLDPIRNEPRFKALLKKMNLE